MLLRALFVMLVVLNAGVASWWLFRAPPRAPGTPVLPAGVPALQLADAPRTGSTRSAPSVAPVPQACYRYGPFRDPAAFAAARTAIAPGVLWTATGRSFASAPRGWRVVLPQATREQATATAQRIGAAGFGDFLVLPPTGADANAIALGRYTSQTAARERARSLVAAGFPALAEPVGGREVLWLDVAAGASFDPGVATPGMPGAPIPCEGVVRDGRYTVTAPA